METPTIRPLLKRLCSLYQNYPFKFYVMKEDKGKKSQRGKSKGSAPTSKSKKAKEPESVPATPKTPESSNDEGGDYNPEVRAVSSDHFFLIV